MAARALAVALLCLSCRPGTSPASRPRLQGCEVSVAEGTVRFTIRYTHSRPLPGSLLVVAAIRASGGEEVLRAHVHRTDRAILVKASGRELLSADGWVQTRTAEGGTVELTLPERVPGAYDLAGREGSAQLVLQAERGEGAVPLGELATGTIVF